MTERPSAATRFARDLREIQDLSDALTAQAINKARDRLMPGGLAMVALAPVASPSTYDEQISDLTTRAIETAIQFDLDPEDLLPEIDPDTWRTPLQLLLKWTEQIRSTAGKDYLEHHTLESETRLLTWALADLDLAANPDFPAIADDVNKARSTLEVILYAGRRAERTRVLCDRDHCTKHPPLIRVRAPREVAGWRCKHCATETAGTTQPDQCGSCESPDLEPVWVSDPDDDRFKCTSCKTWFDDDAYRRAHAKQLRSEGAERFVRLVDAIATLRTQGRSAETVRNWLRPIEHVADRCTICKKRQEPDEYPACPQYVIDKKTKQIKLDENGEEITCGGDLVPVWSADLDDIVQGWCDLATKERMVWWPDLWRRHLTTPIRKRSAA